MVARERKGITLQDFRRLQGVERSHDRTVKSTVKIRATAVQASKVSKTATVEPGLWYWI